MAKKKATTKKKSYVIVTKPQEFLDKTPKAAKCTLAKDKNGYFCYTHRARSKSYKTIKAIPKSVIEFIESTG